MRMRVRGRWLWGYDGSQRLMPRVDSLLAEQIRKVVKGGNSHISIGNSSEELVVKCQHIDMAATW